MTSGMAATTQNNFRLQSPRQGTLKQCVTNSTSLPIKDNPSVISCLSEKKTQTNKSRNVDQSKLDL